MAPRILFLSLMILFFLHPSAATAAEKGFYLGLNAGSGFPGAVENSSYLGNFNLEYKPGLQGSMILGYQLDRGSALGIGRMELELAFRRNVVDKIEFSDGKFGAAGESVVWNAMLNTFGEYPNRTLWTPYVGGGIGLASVSLKGIEVSGFPVIDDSATVFAYQLGFGADYALSKKVKFDFGYRYFATARPELTDVTGVEISSQYKAHSLLFGLRFMLGGTARTGTTSP